MAIEVTNNEEANRFEAAVPGGRALLEYNRFNQGIVLTHAEVPEEAAGEGVGGALVRAAIAWARETDMRVIPTCPFARAYLLRHPDLMDVVR
jgi:uncharacterized protein